MIELSKDTLYVRGEDGTFRPVSAFGTGGGAYVLPTASADTLGGVKVGEGLQMDGDVLGVLPEGAWELIETTTIEDEGLTAIERSSFPDGTPYKLSAAKVFVYYFYPLRDALGVAVDFFADEIRLGNLVGYVESALSEEATHKTTCIFQAKPNAGLYEFVFACGKQGANMNISWPSNGGSQTTPSSKKIDTIRFSQWQGVIPKGTKFEIWGVRANA